jgi:hypothetical protein
LASGHFPDRIGKVLDRIREDMLDLSFQAVKFIEYQDGKSMRPQHG